MSLRIERGEHGLLKGAEALIASPSGRSADRFGVRAGVALLLAGLLSACAAQRWDHLRSATPQTPELSARELPLPPPPQIWMSRPAAIPCLDLSGAPYSRGFALGRARAKSWADAVARYEEQRSALGDLQKTLEINERDGWNSEGILREEERSFILGVADGAELPLAAVLALGLARDAPRPGSFALLAIGLAAPARGSQLLLGLGGPQAATGYEISRHRVSEGQGYWILGQAGCLGGYWGENESGLFVYAVSFSPSTSRSAGLLNSLLVPRLLQRASNLQELRSILARSPLRQGCQLIAYSRKEKRGLSLDLDGESMAIRFLSGRTNDCLALCAEGPPPSKPWRDLEGSEQRRVLEGEAAVLSWPLDELAFKQLLKAAVTEQSSLVMSVEEGAERVRVWLRADTLGDYELSERRRAQIKAAALSPGEWPLSRLRIEAKPSPEGD